MHLVKELKTIEVELSSALADFVDVKLVHHVVQRKHLTAHEYTSRLADHVDVLSMWRVPAE